MLATLALAALVTTSSSAAPVDARLERLRALLARTPSSEAFRDVFDVVAESKQFPELPPWKDAAARDAAIEEALRALTTWDDALRAYPPDSTYFVDRSDVKPYSNKEIAKASFVAEGTVKNHISSILQKLGVRDRTRAVLRALHLGFI